MLCFSVAEFGLAAGVLQVAGFGAEVGSALYRALRDIKNAARDVEALSKEVDATSSVLKSVGHLLGNPKTASLHTKQLVADTENVLNGCNDVFRELEDAARVTIGGLSEQSAWRRLSSKAKWPLSKSRVLELQGVLERYRGVMHMMLTVLQIGEGRNAATSDQLQSLEQRLEILITTRIGSSLPPNSVDTALDSIIQPVIDQQPLHGPSVSRGNPFGPPLKHSHKTSLAATILEQYSTSSTGPQSLYGNVAPYTYALVGVPEHPPPARPTPGTNSHMQLPSYSRPPVQRPGGSQRGLSGSTLAVSVSEQQQDPLHADLERCRDAVDRLADCLAATLAALQGHDQSHAASTDLSSALQEALEQAKQLPAGLRCKTCNRQISWQHAGQVARCENWTTCRPRGLTGRLITSKYSVRHVETEYPDQYDRAPVVQTGLVRDAKGRLVKAQDSSIPTRRSNTAMLVGRIPTSPTPSGRIAPPAHTREPQPRPSCTIQRDENEPRARVRLSHRQRQSGAAANDPFASTHTRHMSGDASSHPDLDGDANEHSRTLKRKPPLKLETQHAKQAQLVHATSLHKPLGTMISDAEWRERSRRLASSSSDMPMVVAESVRNESSAGYATAVFSERSGDFSSAHERCRDESFGSHLVQSHRTGHELGSSMSYGLAANATSGKSAIRTPAVIMAARAAREHAARTRAAQEQSSTSAASVDVKPLGDMTHATASFGSARSEAGVGVAGSLRSDVTQHADAVLIGGSAVSSQGAQLPITRRMSYTDSPVEPGMSKGFTRSRSSLTASSRDSDDSLFALPVRSVAQQDNGAYDRRTTFRLGDEMLADEIRLTDNRESLRDRSLPTSHPSSRLSIKTVSEHEPAYRSRGTRVDDSPSAAESSVNEEGKRSPPSWALFTSSKEDLSGGEPDSRARGSTPPVINAATAGARLGNSGVQEHSSAANALLNLPAKKTHVADASPVARSDGLLDLVGAKKPGRRGAPAQPYGVSGETHVQTRRSSDSSGPAEGPTRKSWSKDSGRKVRDTAPPTGAALRNRPPPPRVTTTTSTAGVGRRHAPPPAGQAMGPPPLRASMAYAKAAPSRRQSMAAAASVAQTESKEAAPFITTDAAAALLRRWLVFEPEV